LCTGTPRYKGQIINNFIDKENNQHISLEDKHKELEEILNMMVRHNPDERPTAKKLIEVFGKLLKNPERRQKLLLAAET